MCQDLFDLQRQYCDSAIALLEANAYNRLTSKIIFEDPLANFMTASEVQSSHDIFNNPWADCPHLQYYTCEWCRQGDHDTKMCKALNLCWYCNQFGHLKDNC